MKDYQKIAQFREHANFLGYEFLTWLFLLLDKENAKDEIAAIVNGLLFKTNCSIVLGGRLVTCLLQHKEQKTSITSPILEESHEVFASLKNGHVIEALALAFLLGEAKISLVITAQDFAISQAKIINNFEMESHNDDAPLSDVDQIREDLFLRMAALHDVEAVIDRLYEKFLSLRIDTKHYPSLLHTMRDQVESRLSHYLRKDHHLKLALL